MGCDIHLYVEVRKNGKWQSADTWEYIDDEEDMLPYWDTPYGKEFYRRRNYDLFAMLANVRNYQQIKPFAYPRGIPLDCCTRIKDIVIRWIRDGHSHSYFTLVELEVFFNINKEYKDLAGEFYTETMPKLRELGSPEDVRIVFFFDN